MTNVREIYKCEICGNIVEVIQEGAGELVCCGEPMQKAETKHQEEMINEKHIPALKKYDDNKWSVVIGNETHPMTNEHYIQFIEAVSSDGKYMKRVYLKPNEKAELELDCICNNMIAREYCNIHGLFEAELKKY